jgi:nucleosome assembly protein 1-like 1
MSEKDTSPALEEASGESPALPAEESEPTPALVIDRFANMNVSPADDDDSTDHDDSHNSDQSDDDESDHPMSTLPPYVLERVEKLKTLNTQRDEIMEQYLKDRAALEAKYHDLCKPLYSERAAIIKGEKDEEIGESKEGDVADDQAETVDKDEDEKVDESQANDNNDENKVIGIPQFWICAMTHMEPLAELIAEDDVDALEYLQNIACIDDADGTGFTLEFHFSPNDYFENTVLTKRYEIPNLLLDDEPILKNVEGCKIEWKPGMSLTYQETTKKQRGTGKNSGKVRTIKKKERLESFFHFFEPPKMPSMQDMDEDAADRLEAAFEEDYDVAQAFRSHIVPKAVTWFTGQVSLVQVLFL